METIATEVKKYLSTREANSVERVQLALIQLKVLLPLSPDDDIDAALITLQEAIYARELWRKQANDAQIAIEAHMKEQERRQRADDKMYEELSNYRTLYC